jgi:hypothetical protein
MSDNEYRNDVREFTKEARWTGMKLFFGVFLPLFIVVAIAGGVYTFVIKPAQIIDRVTNPDNVLFQVEWFVEKATDLEAAVERVEVTKKALADFQEDAGPRENWDFQDKQLEGNMRTDLRGQEAHLEKLKAEYIAASKTPQRSIFKIDNDAVRKANELCGLQE